MIQTDNVVVPDVDVSTAKGAVESLKGLSFDDAIAKIANSIVDFSFRLLIALVVLYVGKIVIKWIYRTVKRIMISREVDVSLTTFVLSLVKILLYFILIVTIVGILGIETSSFLALFASAGVAIGMALSGTLQNFAGGVLILLLKPYKVGDYIEAQGYAGKVKAIQIFHTIINTTDNKAIIIPNGALSTSSINNFSLETYRRVDWNVSLAYGTDLPRACDAIKEILLSDERIVKGGDCEEIGKTTGGVGGVQLRECGPFAELGELGDSSINITVRAWTLSENYWGVFFEMNNRFYNELPQKGFSFPFPQLDVHIEK